MLFAYTFGKPNLLGRIRRFREHPIRMSGVALILVGLATLIRLALHQQLSTAAPFTSYSLVVIFMALAGGFWPGIGTLALSLITGSILFLPPPFSFTLAEGAGWTLFMFGLFGSINVALISGLVGGILAHDEHQQFLFRELGHRSQNLFAVIQSIVSRTLVEGQTLSEAKRSLEKRLSALARTHGMLADSGWTAAPLDRIVSEELMSFAAQVNVTGCDIPLNTPAAQNLSLILHELTTNAVKYGALSRPEGRVIIEGKIETEINGSKRFRLTWKELDGPAVTQSGRKGFGSTILYGLAKQVAQNVEAKFRPEGLFYELQIPLKSIEGSKTDFQRLLNWPSVQPQRNGRSELSAGTSRCHPNPA